MADLSMTKVTIIPESLEVANTYLELGGSVEATALRLNVSEEVVTRTLNEAQVKQYINSMYLDAGYRNRHRIGAIVDEMIEEKLTEGRDVGHLTKADLLDLLKFSHSLRMDEEKIQNSRPSTAVQINDYGGGNYQALMERLMK